jgi:hypothetical protein
MCKKRMNLWMTKGKRRADCGYRAGASLGSQATRAVENHPRMWTTKLENS